MMQHGGSSADLTMPKLDPQTHVCTCTHRVHITQEAALSHVGPLVYLAPYCLYLLPVALQGFRYGSSLPVLPGDARN